MSVYATRPRKSVSARQWPRGTDSTAATAATHPSHSLPSAPSACTPAPVSADVEPALPAAAWAAVDALSLSRGRTACVQVHGITTAEHEITFCAASGALAKLVYNHGPALPASVGT